MSQGKRRASGQSKAPPAPKGGKSRTKGREIHPTILIFKSLFLGKNPRASVLAGLEVATGASRSFCEKVLDGRKQPGAAMLEALIRSEFGAQIALGIARGGGHSPAWARGFARHLELAELVEAQRLHALQIEKLQRELFE